MKTDISYWHTTAKYGNNWPFLAAENTSVVIILATVDDS